MRNANSNNSTGSFPDPEQLERFFNRLTVMRKKCIERLSQLTEELNQNDCVSNGKIDQACRELECRRKTTMYLRHKEWLEQIEAALLRIKRGEFGYCTETGEKISLERLEVNPLVELCSEAQFRKEQHEKFHRIA